MTNIGTTTEGTVYSVVDSDNDSEVYLTLATEDLSFKAKSRSRTTFDYGVRKNIKLRKSNSTGAQVHAINTLLNSVKGSKLSS